MRVRRGERRASTRAIVVSLSALFALTLGATLARRELNVGFRVVFERLENFRLQADAADPVFAPNALLHGLESLPLAFDARH